MSETPEEFWQRAVTKSSINRLQIVLGQDNRTASQPPTWEFFGESAEADTQAVLDGERTVLCSRVESLTGLPAIGDLSILAWPDGSAAALITTVDVEVLDWESMTDEIAIADGAKNVADWRAINGEDPVQIVVEHIKVMYV